MPQVDVAATRAAAERLGAGGEALRGASSEVRLAELAGGLSGSGTSAVLADVQVVGRQRLVDAGRELETLQEGMVRLADHTAAATGER